MKLQEKHLEATHSKIPWSGNAEQADNNYSKAAEASAQITKDYMKRFAEWENKNYEKSLLKKGFYYSLLENIQGIEKYYAIDELIEIFLETEK